MLHTLPVQLARAHKIVAVMLVASMRLLIAGDILFLLPPWVLWYRTYNFRRSSAWEAVHFIVAFVCLVVYDSCDVSTGNECVTTHGNVFAYYNAACLNLIPATVGPFLDDNKRTPFMVFMSVLVCILGILFDQKAQAIVPLVGVCGILMLHDYGPIVWHNWRRHMLLIPSSVFAGIAVIFRILNDAYPREYNSASDMSRTFAGLWRLFAMLAIALLFADLPTDVEYRKLPTSPAPTAAAINFKSQQKHNSLRAALLQRARATIGMNSESQTSV